MRDGFLGVAWNVSCPQCRGCSRVPKQVPLEYLKNLSKYNDDPSCVVSHVLSLVRYASMLEKRHEDLLVVSFLCSLEIKQRGWIRNSCSPKSITSLGIFVEEFLKHWGPKFQSFEDTYHELLTLHATVMGEVLSPADSKGDDTIQGSEDIHTKTSDCCDATAVEEANLKPELDEVSIVGHANERDSITDLEEGSSAATIEDGNMVLEEQCSSSLQECLTHNVVIEGQAHEEDMSSIRENHLNLPIDFLKSW
jgi:hypothetical protein